MVPISWNHQCGFTWSHLIACDFRWFPLISCDVTVCFPLVSCQFDCTSLSWTTCKATHRGCEHNMWMMPCAMLQAYVFTHRGAWSHTYWIYNATRLERVETHSAKPFEWSQHTLCWAITGTRNDPCFSPSIRAPIIFACKLGTPEHRHCWQLAPAPDNQPLSERPNVKREPRTHELPNQLLDAWFITEHWAMIDEQLFSLDWWRWWWSLDWWRWWLDMIAVQSPDLPPAAVGRQVQAMINIGSHSLRSAQGQHRQLTTRARL